MHLCIFVGTSDYRIPSQPNTADNGYEMSVDIILSAALAYMHAPTFYKIEKHVSSNDYLYKREKEIGNIRFYFVSEEWEGNQEVYKGEMIPEYRPGKDIAINVHLKNRGITFCKEDQVFATLLNFLYPKDHKPHEAFKPFVDFITSPRGFVHYTDLDSPHQRAIGEMLEISMERNRLKNTHHLNDPIYSKIHIVSRTTVSLAHIMLTKWLEDYETAKDKQLGIIAVN